MRILVCRHSKFLAAAALVASLCVPLAAQTSPNATDPVAGQVPDTIDGCEVIARINGQVVLACEVLWQVNLMIEANRDRIPPEQIDAVRQQLMKRHLSSLLDTKLLNAEFRRTLPPENMPQVEENLRKHFEENELPELYKQLEVDNQRDLERKLVALGSSLADTRRSFNEKVIASEWLRSKVKINEEVGRDELLQYYQSHLADYEYPTQARWEELMVHKDKYQRPAEAYAELAQMGNAVLSRAPASAAAAGPLFAEVARAKSDGFTASEGGVHKWTTKGSLKADAIDAALFQLPVGQMSKIIETDTGFHVVRVLERKEASRKPFTDVQAEIRERIKDQRFRKEVNKYLDELRADARIWTVFTGPTTADVLLGRAPEQGATRR